MKLDIYAQYIYNILKTMCNLIVRVYASAYDKENVHLTNQNVYIWPLDRKLNRTIFVIHDNSRQVGETILEPI